MDSMKYLKCRLLLIKEVNYGDKKKIFKLNKLPVNKISKEDIILLNSYFNDDGEFKDVEKYKNYLYDIKYIKNKIN